jgi:isopentenyl diphosphate isomerase/L-lactate dehydrogenase-like FMN-dependent dehydrogenase
VLVDVAHATASTTVLGREISMPLLVAPLAFQRAGHPDGELGMARAARDTGTIMCLSTNTTATPADVTSTGAPCWFQLYVLSDAGLTRELVAQARDDGFEAIVVTVDAPVYGRRERDLRSGFALPDDILLAAYDTADNSPGGAHARVSPTVVWSDIERIAAESGLPLVLKGIVAAEDAVLACEHGAAGLIVSNHGGRELDGVLATIDALPAVSEAVGGRIEVLLDGGIRRGTDVVKALALGADAVLAGRGPFWGLVVDGEAGARRVLELLRDEILLALQLLGCNAPSEVSRAHVTRRV